MIGSIKISVNAAHPQLALPAVYAYAGSPSSVRVLDVPKKIGQWQITEVSLQAQYPDESTIEIPCVLVGGAWVGTLPKTIVTGVVQNGFTIFASGIDENGDDITGYVLGKGDINILDAGTIPQQSYFVKVYDEIPENPKSGNLYKDGEDYVIWQNGEANAIGVTHEELDEKADASDLENYYTKSEVDNALSEKADASDLEENYYNKTKVDGKLATKQNTLTNEQLSAIDSVVDERATIVKYRNGQISSFNIVGEISSSGTSPTTQLGDIINAVEVKIGSSVTSIGQYAFQNCTQLTSVTIPDSVTSIGDLAFRHCISLTSVTIGNSVASIGLGAFYYCTNLTSVRIPDSATSIGNSAFKNCTNLTSVRIPDSVTSIGNEAFFLCTNLTSVTIPDSVTSIGHTAFYGCSGLTSVTIGNGVTSIGGNAFTGCSGLTNVTIGDSVTSIEANAFYYCTNLQSMTIPDSVTSIGENAFYNCSGLTSVTIGNSVTSIGSYAFDGCSGLTSVTIPDSVTSIGINAFYGCSGLTSVTFQGKTIEQVRNIEDSTGQVCYPWGITNINIITTWNDASKEYVNDYAISRKSTTMTSPGVMTDYLISNYFGGVRMRFSSQNLDNYTAYAYNGVAVKRNNGATVNYLFDTSANDGIVRRSELSTKVNGDGVTKIQAITQSAYDNLATKDANTLYVING